MGSTHKSESPFESASITLFDTGEYAGAFHLYASQNDPFDLLLLDELPPPVRSPALPTVSTDTALPWDPVAEQHLDSPLLYEHTFQMRVTDVLQLRL